MGGNPVLRGVHLPGGVPRGGAPRGARRGHRDLSGRRPRVPAVRQAGWEVRKVLLLHGPSNLRVSAPLHGFA